MSLDFEFLTLGKSPYICGEDLFIGGKSGSPWSSYPSLDLRPFYRNILHWWVQVLGEGREGGWVSAVDVTSGYTRRMFV